MQQNILLHDKANLRDLFCVVWPCFLGCLGRSVADILKKLTILHYLVSKVKFPGFSHSMAQTTPKSC